MMPAFDTYDEKRRHDYPVGSVVMNVRTVGTESQILPGFINVGTLCLAECVKSSK